MKTLLENSSLFGMLLTLSAYLLGLLLKKKLHLPIFNPLLTAIALCMLFLMATGIEYDSYKKGAEHIAFLLTPATVCLAIPLYEQMLLLKKNLKAIIIGIASGVLTSSISILGMSVLFRLNHTEYVTLLPKSITTAIGIGLSDELNGYISITVAAIMITGLFGNIAGEALCRFCGITHPVAKGVAIGTSSHVMGTSKAMEMGEIEGAMSSLSIAVAGCMTVAAAVLFENLI